MFRKEIFYQGDCLVIKALVKVTTSNRIKHQVVDFIEGRSEREQKKIIRLIKFIGDKWPIRNEQKFKKIKGCDYIYELKPSQKIRIFSCFSKSRGELILLEGIIKERSSLPQSVYERICKKYKEVCNES